MGKIIKKARQFLEKLVQPLRGKMTSPGGGPIPVPVPELRTLRPPRAPFPTPYTRKPSTSVSSRGGDAPAPGSSEWGHRAPDFERLNELIFTSIFQLLGVKEEMVDTSKAYRAVMPPCRLQLFPRASPFKAPPNALDWVLLYHKPENLGNGGAHSSKPYRRWHKRLKINCRRDLNSAIYGLRLFEQRSTIMGFFDRTRALNTAHRALARAIGNLRRSLSMKYLPEGWEDPPLEFITAPWLRNLPDEILARKADSWSLQREIEKLDHAIEGLIRRTKSDLWRLTSSQSPEGFVKVFWENPSTGKSLGWLRARSRGKQSGSPDDQKLAELEKERRALVETHKKLLSKVKSNDALLAKALEEAKEALGSCDRIPYSQDSRTRFSNIRIWNPDSWPLSGGSELRVRRFQLPPPSL